MKRPHLTAHQELAEKWVDAGKAHLIEQDDPSWWAAVKALSIKKHYGPGPHPGTGTPQSVHGHGGAMVRSPSPVPIGQSDLPPHPDSPNGQKQAGARRLIERGKELRPEFDAVMSAAHLKAVGLLREVERIRDREAVNGDWNTLASHYKWSVRRKLVLEMERHYPDATGSDINHAMDLTKGDLAKFHYIMQHGEPPVPDVASKVKLTRSQEKNLSYEWFQLENTSAPLGVRVEDGYLIIPSTEAGNKLAADIDFIYDLEESGPKRKMWYKLLDDIRAAGPYTVDRRTKSKTFKYVDPTVYISPSDSNQMILSGAAADERFWATGTKSSKRKIDGEWRFVELPNRGIYRIDPAVLPGGFQTMSDGQHRPLIFGEYDLGARGVAEGGDSRAIKLSEVTGAMWKEYAFWDRQSASLAEEHARIWKEQSTVSREANQVYRDAFTGWLSQYRDIGTTADVKRRTKVGIGVSEAAKVYPSEWIEAVNARGPLSVTKTSGRGNFGQGGKLAIRSDGSFDTNVHELGHAIEHVYAPLGDAQREFYRMRTGGSEETLLQDERPGHRYRSYEVTKKDRFADPYMGRNYDYGNHFELTSMAMPRLANPGLYYTNYREARSPVHDATPYKMDDEMVNWFLGVLVDV